MAIQISISNAIGSRYRGSVVPPVDPDAQAFITAAGITNPTQQSAINTLVVDLKGYSIWTKFKAIYPIVGGVASSHAVNLKTPGTFNLTFATGLTHSANGMISAGAGYANTNLNQSVLSQNSTHLSFYSRTNVNANEAEIGINGPNYNMMQIRVSGAGYYLINTAGLPIASETDSRGFFIGNRQSSNDIDAWKNGVKKLNGTTASATVVSGNLFLLAYNNQQGGGGASAVSTKQCAFASIGDGLTDTDAANFYTAVQAFQTTLGRAVIENQILNLDAGNSLSYPGTGTTWTDISSSNGYNGTLNGGVAYSTSNGGVLVYDGVDDYVVINSLSKNALANPTGKWTIQFWVYISGSQSSIGVFQMADVLSSSNPWLLLQRQTNTSIRWYVNGGYRITQTITTNTWYNLAINFDGTTVKFYTNGVEEATTYGGGLGVASAASTFLANGFSGYLNGRMPQIQAYTTNLSAAQILQNYNNQKTRYI